MVDALHERPEGTAKRNFSENRKRFIKSKDFFEVSRNAIRTDLQENVFSKFAPNGILLTESGYFKVAKIQNDDKSWDVD